MQRMILLYILSLAILNHLFVNASEEGGSVPTTYNSKGADWPGTCASVS